MLGVPAPEQVPANQWPVPSPLSRSCGCCSAAYLVRWQTEESVTDERLGKEQPQPTTSRIALPRFAMVAEDLLPPIQAPNRHYALNRGVVAVAPAQRAPESPHERPAPQ